MDNLFRYGIISDDEKKTPKTSESRLGIMYGLPKVHKSGLPLRPILSTVNSYNYCLSKYLVYLLKPFTVGSFSVKDSFTFASEVGKLRNCIYSMATFLVYKYSG